MPRWRPLSNALLAIRLRALGDVVLTTPAFRALHRGFPEAPLDIVTDQPYVALLQDLPGVDRVIGLGRGPGAMRAVLTEIRRRSYARAIDFFGNPRSALMTVMSRARDSFGYDLRGRGRAYRHRIPRDSPVPSNRREYAAASHVRLAVAAGGVDDGLHTQLSISPAAHAEAEVLLHTAGVREPGTTLGLIAAGTWATKTWPASHAAALARLLLASGREVLLLAGPREAHVTRAVQELAPGLATLPPCEVPALAAVISRLAGVLGTDSGPRHIAAALGRPTFAWFGPTHPDNWTAPDPSQGVWWTAAPCRGCNRTQCPHWVCLPEFHPDRAFALVQEHFARHGGTATDFRTAARA